MIGDIAESHDEHAASRPDCTSANLAFEVTIAERRTVDLLTAFSGRREHGL